MMQGFGVNTYTLVNEKHERVFVKFHFVPELGGACILSFGMKLSRSVVKIPTFTAKTSTAQSTMALIRSGNSLSKFSKSLKQMDSILIFVTPPRCGLRSWFLCDPSATLNSIETSKSTLLKQSKSHSVPAI